MGMGSPNSWAEPSASPMSLCIHFVEKLVVKSLLKTKGALKEINPDLAALLSRMSSIRSGCDAALGAQHHPFIECLHQVGEDQVLRELGLQAQPGASAIVKLLAHGFQIWLRFFKHGLVAADHEGESGVDRAGRGAGARRVQEMDALGAQLFADAAAGAG